jgi:hypothetical protein
LFRERIAQPVSAVTLFAVTDTIALPIVTHSMLNRGRGVVCSAPFNSSTPSNWSAVWERTDPRGVRRSETRTGIIAEKRIHGLSHYQAPD